MSVVSNPLYIMAFIVFWIFWGAPIGISAHLGYSRGRTGWMWGLFLGWLGVFILACMRPVNSTKTSPQ